MEKHIFLTLVYPQKSRIGFYSIQKWKLVFYFLLGGYNLAIYLYVYIYTCMYVYIYIYIQLILA